MGIGLLGNGLCFRKAHGRLPVAAIVSRHRKRKKTDVVAHPQVFDHVGLLFNEPPGTAGLPLIQSSDDFDSDSHSSTQGSVIA